MDMEHTCILSDFSYGQYQFEVLTVLSKRAKQSKGKPDRRLLSGLIRSKQESRENLMSATKISAATGNLLRVWIQCHVLKPITVCTAKSSSPLSTSVISNHLALFRCCFVGQNTMNTMLRISNCKQKDAGDIFVKIADKLGLRSTTHLVICKPRVFLDVWVPSPQTRTVS